MMPRYTHYIPTEPIFITISSIFRKYVNMSTTKVKPEVAWPKCDDAGENPDWGFVGVDAATQCMSVRACCLVLTKVHRVKLGRATAKKCKHPVWPRRHFDS